MNNWVRRVKGVFYDDGKVKYLCNAEIYGSTDFNYGADADGRRGYSRDFIDEVVLEDIEVTYFDENGNEKGRADIAENVLPDKIYEELCDIAIGRNSEND